jgi:hypothetical protein
LNNASADKFSAAGSTNMDDLLEKALDALEEKETAAAPVTHYERPAGRKSLVELFAESPLKGLNLDFSRNKSGRDLVDSF